MPVDLPSSPPAIIRPEHNKTVESSKTKFEYLNGQSIVFGKIDSKTNLIKGYCSGAIFSLKNGDKLVQFNNNYYILTTAHCLAFSNIFNKLFDDAWQQNDSSIDKLIPDFKASKTDLDMGVEKYFSLDGGTTWRKFEEADEVLGVNNYADIRESEVGVAYQKADKAALITLLSVLKTRTPTSQQIEDKLNFEDQVGRQIIVDLKTNKDSTAKYGFGPEQTINSGYFLTAFGGEVVTIENPKFSNIQTFGTSGSFSTISVNGKIYYGIFKAATFPEQNKNTDPITGAQKIDIVNNGLFFALNRKDLTTTQKRNMIVQMISKGLFGDLKIEESNSLINSLLAKDNQVSYESAKRIGTKSMGYTSIIGSNTFEKLKNNVERHN